MTNARQAMSKNSTAGIHDEWLNYHHLHYFWRIAREGSLSRAARSLRLTHSTLSTQLKSLEDFLGAPLFERQGRRLALTPFGTDVASRSEEIFRAGREIVDLARGRGEGRRAELRVGALPALPKTVVCRLLEPALAVGSHRLGAMRHDSIERLVEDLVAGKLHLVLTDAPAPPSRSHKAFSHLLGESDVLLYGTASLARRWRKGFPSSLDGAPLLLPSAGTSLRRLVDRWLVDRGIRVEIEGEFEDAAMMRAFGLRGRGLFPVRAALQAELDDRDDVVRIGALRGLHERYYAVTVDRRVRHPAVAALIEAARENLVSKLG